MSVVEPMTLGRLRKLAGRPVALATLASFALSLSPARWADAQAARELGTSSPTTVSSEALESAVDDMDEQAHTFQRVEPSVDDLQRAGSVRDSSAPEASPTPNQLASPPDRTDLHTLALPTGADKSGITSQSISVPKGSGTIQGMEESFSAQLSTGIAGFSVPFALPNARGKAQPSLGLSYSSSGGFGVAGAGWSVGAPFVARQTDRGTPKYDDRGAWHPEQDRFVFNGGQELVPVCVVGDAAYGCAGRLLSGEELPRWVAPGDQYFRPRVEGSFLRFFWHANKKTWRVQDKSGITMELGVPLNEPGYEGGLEKNPDAPASTPEIYRWHLVRQYDTYGDANPATGAPQPANVVLYRYQQNAGMAYLADIFDTPPPGGGATDFSDWAHHTRIAYEERADPTESYRSGWKIEQRLRVARVEVGSKTADASGPRRRVRQYHLGYDDTSHVSLLTKLRVEGRCEGEETSAPEEGNEAVTCRALPPMTFDYTHVNGTTRALGKYEAFAETQEKLGASPKYSIDDRLTDLFDVNSDGLPDVLVTAPALFNGNHGVFFNGRSPTGAGLGAAENRLGLGFTSSQIRVEQVASVDSNVLKLSNDNVASLDLDADGKIDLVHMPRVKKYEIFTPELRSGNWWWAGRQIETADKQDAKIDFTNDNPKIRVMDVNFDGLVDIVATTGTEIQTFFSLGRYPGGDGQFGHAEWTGPDKATLSTSPVTSCLPWSATAVQFSDPDIRIGDMNADGIPDIVRVRPGDIHYWPGRGNGFWGTGRRDDCRSGSFADKRHVAMKSSPQYGVVQGETTLLLDDVNGDGLDDLVEIRFNAVDIYVNVDGVGWTQRHVLFNTPPKPEFANRVRLVDVDGSGTRDILWANGYDYRFIDLQGGTRPWLLAAVKNGLGKETKIEYAASTEQMITAGALPACTPEQLDVDPFACRWATTMPTVVHVVTSFEETDGLTVAGFTRRERTEYTYRDPVYDGRQREFRGFRRARTKRVGDANSPSDLTQSLFLLGECRDETNDGRNDCAVENRWIDNPREALKGLPVLTEKLEDSKKSFLSTGLTSYRLRHLHTGLDGRAVRHAFESRTTRALYDTGPFKQATGPPVNSASAVELEAPLDTLDTTNELVRVPMRSTDGTATVEYAHRVDRFGNQTEIIANGCAACGDEVITTHTVPARPQGEPTGWLWRTVESFVVGDGAAGRAGKGSVTSHTMKRNHTLTRYTLQGDAQETTAILAGTQLLERVQAGTPAGAAIDGAIVLSRQEYDSLGNLIRETAADGRCRDVGYEQHYKQLPASETIYAGPVGAGGCGALPLSTSASYDRGFEAVRVAIDMQGQTTFAEYDAFSRLSTLTRPHPYSAIQTGYRGRFVSALPSVKLSYLLPGDGLPEAARHSIIRTQVQDSADHDVDGYLESFSYVDGLGRTVVTLNEADPGTGDGGSWIATALIDYDDRGSVRRKYLEHFVSPAEPTAFDFGTVPPVPHSRQRYDAFGRQLQTFDLDGTVTLQSVYHALRTDLYDAADLQPGPHQGTFASETQDGHGRTVILDERYHQDGVIEQRHVQTTYLPTNEPEVIRRVRVGSNAAPVVRWMLYDSLGRMVLNVEPNTSVGFVPEPTDTGAGIKAWRYAYNESGDLVGTSDARGCGVNYAYDAAGRLLSEDYFPCLASHAPYSAPDAAAGKGVEVLYLYDGIAATLPAGVTIPPGFNRASAFLRGRLFAVLDRASATFTTYDGRGRPTRMDARVSRPGVADNVLANRYAPRWYTRVIAYDAAEREVDATTGSTIAELQAKPQSLTTFDGQSKTTLTSTSACTTEYSRRGTVKAAGGSFAREFAGTQRPLVGSIVRAADGLINQIVYGDAAGTTTSLAYDNRRRLRSVQTYRGPPASWSDPSAYTPSPNPDPNNPTTFQLLLQDEDIKYDVVNNPIETRDWRIPDEWPSGAKPVTRKIQYDDLYRVIKLEQEFANGDDAWTSPFDAENRNGIALDDPRRGQPSPHVHFDKRLMWQAIQYDWLGNTSDTRDDASGFYDRSLGKIENGTATAGPYQLKTATNKTGTPASRDGELAALYDAAGNLVRMIVERNGPCLPIGSNCSQIFSYDWDEVGRLVQAQRWDVPAAALPNLSDPPPSKSPPIVILRYAYDAADERVMKTAVDAGRNEVHTLYVFDSLELRRASWMSQRSPTGKGPRVFDYELTEWTEVPYLFANGLRLARVVWEENSVPTAAAARLHVFFELGDHLGSTSIVIDQATAELVERGTYEAYGAVESDYRPERWKAFREDYKFTGKEEDIEVGLAYFGKRFYAPVLNRWVSPDPLGIHQPADADLNLFAYVRGRPLQAVDPLGLQDIPVNVAPPGVAPGQRFIPVAPGEGGQVSTAEFAQRTAGLQVFVYDPEHGLPPDVAQTIAMLRATFSGSGSGSGREGGTCSGPACGTAGPGEKGTSGPTDWADGVALAGAIVSGDKPVEGGSADGSPGGGCKACPGGKVQQAAIGGGRVGSAVGGAVSAAFTAAKALAIAKARKEAVRLAWAQERKLVELTGEGTVKWTKKQIKELLATGKVKGYIGHHIKNVANHPGLAGNPDNIKFVKGIRQHLKEHLGNWSNKTTGKIIDRQKRLNKAILDIFE